MIINVEGYSLSFYIRITYNDGSIATGTPPNVVTNPVAEVVFNERLLYLRKRICLRGIWVLVKVVIGQQQECTLHGTSPLLFLTDVALLYQVLLLMNCRDMFLISLRLMPA
jgi:hypothetical protein